MGHSAGVKTAVEGAHAGHKVLSYDLRGVTRNSYYATPNRLAAGFHLP